VQLLRGDLIELARRVIGYLSSRIGRALVRMSTLIVEDESLDQARANFLASRLAATRVVVDRAIERGELPADTDPGLVLEMLVAPLHLRTIMTGEPLTDELPERLVDILLDGLLPRG
jgi:hypothetical protein